MAAQRSLPAVDDRLPSELRETVLPKIRTRISALLGGPSRLALMLTQHPSGVRLPILSAPMAGASGGALAAAVTSGGGFGFIGAGEWRNTHAGAASEPRTKGTWMRRGSTRNSDWLGGSFVCPNQKRSLLE